MTSTDDAKNNETLSSAATGTLTARPNRAAAGAPTIPDITNVGQTLTADTSGISHPDCLTGVSSRRQWIANDETCDTDIQDATGSTYTLLMPMPPQFLTNVLYKPPLSLRLLHIRGLPSS